MSIVDSPIEPCNPILIEMESQANAPGGPAGNSPAPHAESLIDGVLILLALTVVQRAVGLLRGVLFCRWLDAEQLGQWDMAFGFLMLAAPVAVLGIPGSFGRYVELYRSRGQLRTFLLRTACCCAALTVLAVGTVSINAASFAEVVFGSRAQAGLMMYLAIALGAVIAYNSLTSLFTALRMNRVVAVMQFVSSLGFALLGGALLLGWQMQAGSVVLAFGASCLVTAAASLVWLRKVWRATPMAAVALGHSELWRKLMPFAVWVWITNWLCNLFDVVDRYMILHFSGLDQAEALAQVGQYHSSRLFPVLLLGLADLFAAMITPHLSHDWETGKRDEVVRRLNMFVKMAGIALFCGAVGIMDVSPALFGWALDNKYAAGLAVLPLTLAYCTWGGLSRVAENYLWCAEKARLASTALAFGLVINVALNLVFLPKWGLWGAVLATAIANLVNLLIVIAAASRLGMQWDRGTLIVALFPLLLGCGPWFATAGALVLLCTLMVGNVIISTAERQQLLTIANEYRQRAVRVTRRRRPVHNA